jgi:uncharacterized Zn finger protein (UPF0148 family)
MKIFIPTEEELKNYITDLINYFEENDRGGGLPEIHCPVCDSNMIICLIGEWYCPTCKMKATEDNCKKIPIQTIRTEYPDLESFLAKQIIAILLPEKFKPDL